VPELREIEVTRFGNELTADRRRPASSWWYDRAKGGGLANAFMPHVIDMALWLAGRRPKNASGFLRTANPQRMDAEGNSYPMDASDGVFAVADLGNGIAARMTVDGTLSLNQMTIGLHAQGRTAVASGTSFADMTLFVIDPGESNEYELKPSPYAKYAPVNGSVPAFMRLLDDFAERLDGGTGNCPTFDDGLAVQRVLSAIGYEA
jgi:predicted dehydrogenase